MRIKLLPFLLSICFVYSQSQVDSAGSNIEDLITDLDKLNNNITTLDSLLKTKPSQSLTDKKFKEIDKSLSDMNEELNSQINSFNSSFKKLKDELTNNINSISDSLINNANRILNIRNEKSFNDAFLKARLEKGKNEEFVWNGKSFTTNYPDESKIPTIILEIEGLRDYLKSRIENLDDDIERVSNKGQNDFSTIVQTIKDRTLYWVIAILIVLITVISIFLVLKSKVAEQKDSLSSVQHMQKKFENDQIQLDTKLIKILGTKLEIASLQSEKTTDVDHSFPILSCEKIHSMRKRLKTMGEQHGTKVLNNQIESLEAKLTDMGYKIVDLVGRNFDDGMELGKAQFIPDDSLKEGERIISRVIKPQITFKGEIIRHADVVISQGD